MKCKIVVVFKVKHSMILIINDNDWCLLIKMKQNLNNYIFICKMSFKYGLLMENFHGWNSIFFFKLLNNECNGSFGVFVVEVVLHLEVLNVNSIVVIIKMFHFEDLQAKILVVGQCDFNFLVLHGFTRMTTKWTRRIFLPFV